MLRGSTHSPERATTAGGCGGPYALPKYGDSNRRQLPPQLLLLLLVAPLLVRPSAESPCGSALGGSCTHHPRALGVQS